MNILVIDIGGTNVKVWTTGEEDKFKIPSGKELTPQALVDELKEKAGDWKFERVSIGYPGEVRHGHPVAEPWNLGDGWVDFDYAAAFGVPVRIMNDACMQALGSYEGGRMLYLGFGTGLGCAFIYDNTIVPLSLGHVPLHNGKSFNDCLSREALASGGVEKFQKRVAEAVEMMKSAFFADYVVLGGGNAKELEELPPGCRRGGNQNAYFGGLRMWEDTK